MTEAEAEAVAVEVAEAEAGGEAGDGGGAETEGEGASSLPRSLISALGDDLLEIIFGKLCNPLEPRHALALSNTSPEFRRPSPSGARAPTQERRRQLRAQHEAAAALCHKVVGLRRIRARI